MAARVMEDPAYGTIVASIRGHLEAAGKAYRPTLGVICGSGLAHFPKILEDATVVPYDSIEGFPKTSVKGHKNEMWFGRLHGADVVCLRGRFHFYEGIDLKIATMPIRVMNLLGVQVMIVTNAAGGLTKDKGKLMIIKDHINAVGLAGSTPLLGQNNKDFGSRFFSMAGAYTPQLQLLLEGVAEELNYEAFVTKGVYACVSGPSFETPAECGMLISAGADAVGMSTAHEVIVAQHCGMKIMGLTLVTNKVFLPDDKLEHIAPFTAPPLEPREEKEEELAVHEEVLEIADLRAPVVQSLLSRAIYYMARDPAIWPKPTRAVPKPACCCGEAEPAACCGKAPAKKRCPFKAHAPCVKGLLLGGLAVFGAILAHKHFCKSC
jgi:purine-nucleoside phosphorylase